jgi:hypothetical protein
MSKLYFPQYTLCSPSGLHRNSRERSVSWVSVFLLRLEPALLPNSCQCSGQIKQGNKIPQNSMFSMHLTFHTHTQTHTNTHSYTHNTHSHTCLCAHAQDHLHAHTLKHTQIHTHTHTTHTLTHAYAHMLRTIYTPFIPATFPKVIYDLSGKLAVSPILGFL